MIEFAIENSENNKDKNISRSRDKRQFERKKERKKKKKKRGGTERRNDPEGITSKILVEGIDRAIGELTNN